MTRRDAGSVRIDPDGPGFEVGYDGHYGFEAFHHGEADTMGHSIRPDWRRLLPREIPLSPRGARHPVLPSAQPTARDIIPPSREEEAPMPHGARHIAGALRDAHRLGGLLDPADTRLEAERTADGTVRAAGPAPGRSASVPAWYAHMVRAPVPGAPSPGDVDWQCGRDAVAWTLGFEGAGDLMAWAEANPDLWGGEANLALLDPSRADGCRITTLEDAARVFDGIAAALGG